MTAFWSWYGKVQSVLCSSLQTLQFFFLVFLVFFAIDGNGLTLETIDTRPTWPDLFA